MKTQNKVPRIVIVGCGFGGLTLAKGLSKLNVKVLLVDKHNYHTFQPLLYQVATGGLEADNIAYPVRKVFRKMTNVFFRMAEVISVNEPEKIVETTIGDLHYDYLVLAMGSTNNYFGFEPVKDKLLPLKSLTDAFNIRSQIILENGDSIKADTVIWTAGVKPVMIGGLEQEGYLATGG
jgi:NADH dehydrogenase